METDATPALTQKEQSSSFLNILYGSVPAEAFFNVWTKPDHLTFSYPMTELESAVDKIGDLAQTQDVYYEVCLQKEKPSPGQRGKTATAAAMPGVWMDIDIQGDVHKKDTLPPALEAALAWVAGLPLAPTMIVSTGGGIHVYWLFKQVWVFDHGEERRRAALLSRRFQAYVIAKAREHGYELDDYR